MDDVIEKTASRGKLLNELAHLEAERAALRRTPAAELRSDEYAKFKSRIREVKQRIGEIRSELGTQ